MIRGMKQRIVPGAPQALRAIFAFHLRVGARVALLGLVPVLGSTAGALIFLGPDDVKGLTDVLFGRDAGFLPALLLLGVALSLAGFAAPRVVTGLAGWLRHLPATGASHRRAAVLAIAVAQAPMFLLIALLAAVPRLTGSAATSDAAVRWAGLPLIALAAAFAVLAARGAATAVPGAAPPSGMAALGARRGAAVLPAALAAGLCAGLGSWTAIAAALALLAFADLAAGSLQRSPASRSWTVEITATTAGTATTMTKGPRRSAAALTARIAWRAVGWRRTAAAFGIAAPPLAAAAFFLHNNPPPLVSLQEQAGAALLGGGTACALLLAHVAGLLATRRPAWPWARTLPWSSRRRVLSDAAFLAALCLPLAAAAACLRPAALAPLLATLPFLALRAAAALRRSPENRVGAMGAVLAEGLLVAGALALLPWLALAFLAAAPWAARDGAARERRLKVSRWMERHHLSAGDPASWSGG
jgi:hypothetical protein